jgi:hypothetical protein
MNPGDRVVTTREWSQAFAGGRRLSGRLHRVREAGMHPDHPERTHTVALDEPFAHLDFLTFDPADLEDPIS